ncbi:cytochrome P450 [Rhodococcus sp. SMB37]|nr:cytochrome P450 [Rhodococcus sp. SMB37]
MRELIPYSLNRISGSRTAQPSRSPQAVLQDPVCDDAVAHPEEEADLTGFDEIDFFTDASLVEDPYPYFEHLRSKCPVTHMPHHGVVAVTGYEEAVEVYRNHEVYSSANAFLGPFPPLPFTPAGDDITAQLAAHRDQLPLNEHMVTMDPPEHTAQRALLKRLLTPKRLKENEEFMWRLADKQIDTFFESGRMELLNDYAKPFALIVVADLLGVPEEDHDQFRDKLLTATARTLDENEELQVNPLEWLDAQFSGYIEDRRKSPRADVLTDLATATFPDGTLPEVIDVVRLATFLFAAGQETTARLLSSSIQVLAERPDIQKQLRDDRELIPAFIEETLRVESPVKTDFRLVLKNTTLRGIDLPAGTPVAILPGAINRDPDRFECPAEFRVDRENLREHIAFGRGVHSCPGGPLARVEAKVSIERFLDRMDDIQLDDAEHGPESDRKFTWEPTYLLRGLNNLHLKYDPIG